jgi:hypothetical protein
MRQNKELESELRSDWEKYNAKCHIEDQMSFMDYVPCTYKGHDVTVETRGIECYILFKCRHEIVGKSTIRHESGVSYTKERCKTCGTLVREY